MTSDQANPPATPAAPAPPPGPTITEDVSLADIDRMLEEDDPQFSAELDAIKSVGTESEVVIESVVEGEEILPVDEEGRSWLTRRFPLLEKVARPLNRIRAAEYTRWLRIRARFINLIIQAWHLCKAVPKRGFSYLKAGFKFIGARCAALLQQFSNLSLVQKIVMGVFVALTVMTLGLLRLNLRGVWWPDLYPPLMEDLMGHADRTWTTNSDTRWMELYRAFPQSAIEYLFPKIIVNLKRVDDVQNPMGVFEFFVVLDSQDSALEIQARSRELHDRMQRAIENLTYAELSSNLGKKRLKDVLRKDLNLVLTQGWVKEVLIKTMVIKP
jgi:flagellar basal body-associated protein FliL